MKLPNYWTFRAPQADALRNTLNAHPGCDLKFWIDSHGKPWLQVVPAPAAPDVAAPEPPAPMDEAFPCPPFCG